MRTPEIRDRLYDLSKAVAVLDPRWGEELRELADGLKRRAPVRCVRARKRKLTEAQVKEVQEYLGAFPDMSYHDISLALNVNTGRISEIAAGRRT